VNGDAPWLDFIPPGDYRTYWQQEWCTGEPEWIVGEDPYGWEGNHHVVYRREEWREARLDNYHYYY